MAEEQLPTLPQIIELFSQIKSRRVTKTRLAAFLKEKVETPNDRLFRPLLKRAKKIAENLPQWKKDIVIGEIAGVLAKAGLFTECYNVLIENIDDRRRHSIYPAIAKVAAEIGNLEFARKLASEISEGLSTHYNGPRLKSIAFANIAMASLDPDDLQKSRQIIKFDRCEYEWAACETIAIAHAKMNEPDICLAIIRDKEKLGYDGCPHREEALLALIERYLVNDRLNEARGCIENIKSRRIEARLIVADKTRWLEDINACMEEIVQSLSDPKQPYMSCVYAKKCARLWRISGNPKHLEKARDIAENANPISSDKSRSFASIAIMTKDIADLVRAEIAITAISGKDLLIDRDIAAMELAVAFAKANNFRRAIEIIEKYVSDTEGRAKSFIRIAAESFGEQRTAK